jgi:hypothetical protein
VQLRTTEKAKIKNNNNDDIFYFFLEYQQANWQREEQERGMRSFREQRSAVTLNLSHIVQILARLILWGFMCYSHISSRLSGTTDNFSRHLGQYATL